MQYSTLALAALAGIAQAVDVQVVNVGWNPVNNATGLKFWPEKITAEAGSMVQFQFWTGSHTVTQSTFDGVCSPMTEGVDSGSMPVEASADKFEIPTYTVMINDTKPLWFYCKTGPHCQEGMAMVVNENTAGNATRSLENYKALAAGESVDSGSGSGSGSGGSTGGSEGGSSGGDATGEVGAPGPDGTPVAGGDAAGSTGESTVPAGAATYGIPSTLLLVLGSAFMLL